MDNLMFDITKLKKLKSLDIESGTRNFISYLTYFEELDNFVETAKTYLVDYTPIAVIYSDDIKKNFFKDTNTIRRKLIMLGMISLASTLSDLDNAVATGNVESLSDGLIKFQAEMIIMKDSIDAARSNSSNTGALIHNLSGKPLILAVDSEPELLSSIVNMLKESYTVMSATSGAAALEIIEKHSPELFLIDIEIPQMNGYELAKHIRSHENFRNTPIIFLSAKIFRGTVTEKHCEYILKPVNKALLLSKIMRCFQ